MICAFRSMDGLGEIGDGDDRYGGDYGAGWRESGKESGGWGNVELHCTKKAGACT